MKQEKALTKKLNKKTIIILLTVIILIQTLVRIYVGAKKEYFHIDEAYSYSLMNYDKIQITENDDFYDNWHTKDYYKDYLSVNSNEVWNLKPVYENQKNDVHPPFFYLLLRIAATFTVDNFTKWTGIILNIVIYIFSSIFIYLISKRVFKDEKKALFTCLISGLCLGALDTTAYIRMYELANLFILILTHIHLRLYDKKELKVKDVVTLGIVAVLSSLTHYYTLVYMAVLFIMFVVKYIKAKEYKNLIIYISCFAIAAIVSLLIFPYSFKHMFMGYRGEGAISSLFNEGTFFTDIGTYLYVLSKGLVGYTFIIVIILYIILRIKNRDKSICSKETNLIIIPTVIYFVLIAKMSPYKELRYVMPIISVSMIYLIYVFDRLFELTLGNKKGKIVTAILFIIITISPLFTGAHLDFTYTKMNHLADKIEEKSDVPALYVFNDTNVRFLDDIYIFTKLDNSYIMKYSNTNIDNIKKVLEGKDLSKGIIFIYNEGVEPDDIIREIKETYNYSQQEEIQRLNCGDVIYLH